MSIDDAQLTGASDSALQRLGSGQRLLPETAAAFQALADDAAAAGHRLCIASAWRSLERQLAIWNGKACGERPVTDDRGQRLPLDTLPRDERIAAILRFSALPGASRHHWGTEVDVYDGAAVAADYRVQLSPAEVVPGGLFDPLHRWLDGRIASGKSYGFYRPYDRDRGGVAPERWHLSYAPLATMLAPRLTEALLRTCWAQPLCVSLCWREELEARLPRLLARYVHNTAPAPDF